MFLCHVVQGRKLSWMGVSFPTNQVLSEKGSILQKKELATKGSKFFPYRVNPFSGCIPQFRKCEPGQKFKYLGVMLKISLKILVAAHFGKNWSYMLVSYC